MSTSFPYFTIARRCGVPYAQVLAQLARWDGKRCNGMDPWPEPADEIKQAIWAAWSSESERRNKLDASRQ